MTYDVLSTYYDSIMSHVNYNEWSNLIDKIIKRYYPKESRPEILELGGGTGTLGKILKKKYNYLGSDICFSMAKIALDKKLPFLCFDAKNIPLKKKFDIIIFLYDGINYFQSLNDYRNVFSTISSSLKNNGLFLFDITTEANSFRYFYDFLDYQQIENTSVIRQSYYDPKKTVQHNDFTFFYPDENTHSLYRKVNENHLQKVFKADQIEKVIPGELFETLGIWDGYTMNKFNKYSERIHFLLKKK